MKTTENSQLPRIEKILYKMPKKIAQGKPTGLYQSSTRSKTVYKPSKISTYTYIKWGLEAANNALRQSTTKGKLGREWSGTDNQGVRWHGYCDQYGNITSFYPDD